MGDTTLVSWAAGREERGNLHTIIIVIHTLQMLLGCFWDDKISLFWLSA